MVKMISLLLTVTVFLTHSQKGFLYSQVMKKLIHISHSSCTFLLKTFRSLVQCMKYGPILSFSKSLSCYFNFMQQKVHLLSSDLRCHHPNTPDFHMHMGLFLDDLFCSIGSSICVPGPYCLNYGGFRLYFTVLQGKLPHCFSFPTYSWFSCLFIFFSTLFLFFSPKGHLA